MQNGNESKSTLSSLGRFRVQDEHLVFDEIIKSALETAFNENRCFPFFPDMDVINGIRAGDPAAVYRESLIIIRNALYDTVSRDDQTIKNRFLSDMRLSARIINALVYIHTALAHDMPRALADRRFTLVRERPGEPTLYHVSSETTVISHVGPGPQWGEIPSIYLGLNIFDALGYEAKRGETRFFEAFKLLLAVEGRAIETGYSHIEIFPAGVSLALNSLLDEVIRISALEELEYRELLLKVKVRRFTEKTRQRCLQMLDKRIPGDEMNFDYVKNLRGIETLERLARIYKRGEDRESLREVARLLVAASGHDLHEVRDRANLVLERILAPKEFDAPLATTFINVQKSSGHYFELELPEARAGYFIRIYRNCSRGGLVLEKDIDYEDLPLEYNEAGKRYCAYRQFDDLGHYDFLVYRRKIKRAEWVFHAGTSGRINVIPDVRGEIILEVFPDIHGHTKVYWMDGTGHPGLVYNEHGEVIRLGRFSDITMHLEDLAKRYFITALYLLGVQKRGLNREDWASEASSPSPFSPMSMVELEPALGGEEEFRELVAKAHNMNIRVIVDIVPHLNRRSEELPEYLSVKCYDNEGNLVVRASTDGRFGSWNDGRLLNYRKLEVWEWLAGSITGLIERYGIDGIRFDSAHAVPIMMKKNNYPSVYGRKRTPEEGLEGDIIVNDREDGHYITTGYYDCACRDLISIPLHYYLMATVEEKLKELGRDFFINIAECYWGHERFLTRVGIIPYNSALFKICENIIHGKTDVREIYHIYDSYFPSVMPRGTELLGILGNHDERRALNTFGHRGLRAAVGITSFMNNMIMDYEGSAEGEGWKVYLDNIYVNWNQFEYAAHRSLEGFYRQWYRFHREARGRGYLVWANNHNVAASMKFTENAIWIGIFNFAESNQSASIQFDNPDLPVDDKIYYKVVDPIYSPLTGHYGYFTGRELKTERINTIVSYTDRVKLLRLLALEEVGPHYIDFLRDSFYRLCFISKGENFISNFSFLEIIGRISDFEQFREFILSHLAALFRDEHYHHLELGIKRALFHAVKQKKIQAGEALRYIGLLCEQKEEILSRLGESLGHHNAGGPLVFISAEADPFSKSGGLANVVYELPREIANMGEEVYVITGYYRHGDAHSIKKMKDALARYNVQYTGRNVRFKILNVEYEVGVHRGMVDGITYFLLDHHEFFDGLYWGVTAEEKLRRRIALARASAEVIMNFGLKPLFTFTNDAYAGLFNGVIRSDPVYSTNVNFLRTTFLHIIHNGGWQYFDAYERYERGFDLFQLFNLPSWKAGDFSDPVHAGRINCMASGIRFADRVITVSPSYARQIEYACDGLEHILSDVIGISNAIGRDFNKRIRTMFRDSGFTENNIDSFMDLLESGGALREKVAGRYPELLKGEKGISEITDPARREIVARACNKMMLQMQRNLEVDPDRILIAMIHRITEQKGFQLLLDASEGLFLHLGFQAIIGGSVSSGDRRGEEIAHGLYQLGTYYPGRVNVSFGFQDVSIPLLAADIFCMPSMNEPGGISQLEAFSAGCLVVARATGGLRDTVFPIRTAGAEVKGNGFLFTDYNSTAFYDAMERAWNFFEKKDDDMIYRARKNCENSVYYWDRPAKKYIEEIYNVKEIIHMM